MLKLCSPFGGASIQFDDKKETSSIFEELLEIMSIIVQRAESLSSPIEHILSQFDGSPESLKRILINFNKQIRIFRELCPYPSLPNMKYSNKIIDLSYRRTIKDPRKLKNYRPFSPEVYGETLFPMIEKMLEKTENCNGIFLDLGSGVGNVCLYFAASRRFRRCLGIEKSSIPYEYSKSLVDDFYTLMSFFGQSFSPIEIFEGDFLDDKFRDTINQSSLIFVNNYSFGPDLDNKLKGIFSQLQNGTKIISSRAFCGERTRRCDRAQSDISAMMHVTELATCAGGVSWTRDPVTYYLHVVDSSLIEKYYTEKKERKIINIEEGNFLNSTPKTKILSAKVKAKKAKLKPLKQKLYPRSGGGRSLNEESKGEVVSSRLTEFVEVLNSGEFSQSCVREICRMKERNGAQREDLVALRGVVEVLEERLVEKMRIRFGGSFELRDFVRSYNDAVEEYYDQKGRLSSLRGCVEKLEKKVGSKRALRHLDGADDTSDHSSLEEGEIEDLDEVSSEVSKESVCEDEPVERSVSVAPHIPRNDLGSLVFGEEKVAEERCVVSPKPIFHEKLSFKISKPLKKSSHSYDSLLAARPLGLNIKKPKMVSKKTESFTVAETSPVESSPVEYDQAYWNYGYDPSIYYPYYAGGYYPMGYYPYGCHYTYNNCYYPNYYPAYGSQESNGYPVNNKCREKRRRSRKRKK